MSVSPGNGVVKLDRGISCEVAELSKVRRLANLQKKKKGNHERVKGVWQGAYMLPMMHSRRKGIEWT